MQNYQNCTAYIAVSFPNMPRTRTGHAAIVVVSAEKQVVFYDSMYHDAYPSAVRHTSVFEKVLGCQPSRHVTSYVDDAIMRGQSYDRAERREKEDIPVGELLSTLPNDLETREKYFQKGQYDIFYQLPATVD